MEWLDRAIGGTMESATSLPSPQGKVPVSSGRVREAALTLFAARGYHGTALSEVAELLEIRTPSLYNHMASKQGVLAEIVLETSCDVWAEHEAAVDGIADVTERLRATVFAYALRHATHPREAMIVNRDISSLAEPTLSKVLELRRRHERAIRALVEEGIELGNFAQQPPSLVSFAVLEMCVSIARWYKPGGEFTPQQIAQHYSSFAVRMAEGEVGAPA